MIFRSCCFCSQGTKNITRDLAVLAEQIASIESQIKTKNENELVKLDDELEALLQTEKKMVRIL